MNYKETQVSRIIEEAPDFMVKNTKAIKTYYDMKVALKTIDPEIPKFIHAFMGHDKSVTDLLGFFFGEDYKHTRDVYGKVECQELYQYIVMNLDDVKSALIIYYL